MPPIRLRGESSLHTGRSFWHLQRPHKSDTGVGTWGLLFIYRENDRKFLNWPFKVFDVGNKGKRKKLNFLTTYSSLTSPWNRQSELPLGAQLSHRWHFAKGKDNLGLTLSWPHPRNLGVYFKHTEIPLETGFISTPPQDICGQSSTKHLAHWYTSEGSYDWGFT